MQRIYQSFLRIEAILAGILLMLMVVMIFTGGVARLMRFPLNWTIDIATCAFAWGVFLCADIAWRRDMLMSVDILTEKFSPGVQRALTLFNYALIVGFLVFLIYSGLHLSWVSRARPFQGIPWASYSWVTLSLPVGAMLMMITTGLKLRDFLGRSAEAARPGA